MTDIKRYGTSGDYELYLSDDGSLCRYEEYQKIKKQNIKLQTEKDKYKKTLIEISKKLEVRYSPLIMIKSIKKLVKQTLRETKSIAVELSLKQYTCIEAIGLNMSGKGCKWQGKNPIRANTVTGYKCPECGELAMPVSEDGS